MTTTTYQLSQKQLEELVTGNLARQVLTLLEMAVPEESIINMCSGKWAITNPPALFLERILKICGPQHLERIGRITPGDNFTNKEFILLSAAIRTKDVRLFNRLYAEHGQNYRTNRLYTLSSTNLVAVAYHVPSPAMMVHVFLACEQQEPNLAWLLKHEAATPAVKEKLEELLLARGDDLEELQPEAEEPPPPPPARTEGREQRGYLRNPNRRIAYNS